MERDEEHLKILSICHYVFAGLLGPLPGSQAVEAFPRCPQELTCLSDLLAPPQP